MFCYLWLYLQPKQERTKRLEQRKAALAAADLQSSHAEE